MPIHHSSLKEKSSQYEDFLREYEPRICKILESTQQLKKQYEILQQQLATPLFQNSNLGLSKKRDAFEQAIAALDNTEDLLSYFLSLLKNHKITPVLASNSSQLDDVQKQITEKIKRLPHPVVNDLLLRCLLSYKSGNNLKNLDTIRFWTGNDLGREGLLDCILYQWNIDYEKTYNKLSKIKTTIEHVSHQQDEARFSVKELLQYLRKLQLLNQKRKGIPEADIIQALMNVIPALQGLDKTKPIIEAIEQRLNHLVDHSPNLLALDKLAYNIKEANKLFRFEVSRQTKLHFTKLQNKFTAKERVLNDRLTSANTPLISAERTKCDEAATTLKQTLKSTSQKTTDKYAKPTFFTQVFNSIENVYTSFERNALALFYGSLPDTLSSDTIDFKPLDSPYFSEIDFKKFLDDTTEALTTATKQLEIIDKSAAKKLDDAADEQSRHKDSEKDIPTDDVHSILGFREPEDTRDAFAKVLTRTATAEEPGNQHNQAAEKQPDQYLAEHSPAQEKKKPAPTPAFKKENPSFSVTQKHDARTNAPNASTASVALPPKALPAKLTAKAPAPSSNTQPLPAEPVIELSAPESNTLPAKRVIKSAAPKSNTLPAIPIIKSAAPESNTLLAKPAIKSAAQSSKKRSLPANPVIEQTSIPPIKEKSVNLVKDNKEETFTTVEEHLLGETPSSPSTPNSSAPHSLSEASPLSSTASSTPLQKNIAQPSTLNISLTNKVLIPHVIAVRRYQSVLKSLSADIQTYLALYESDGVINPDTKHKLETLKSKLDGRVREIDANPITDYRNNICYSKARNIINEDQASFGNTLNIHKAIIEIKNDLASPAQEFTHSWYGWIVNTLHSISKSVLSTVKNIYNKVFTSINDSVETHDTQVADINTASPYAFINSIKAKYEDASRDAIDRIDQYDNNAIIEKEKRLEYLRTSGIFNASSNRANILSTTFTEKNATSCTNVSQANNPQGFYAKPEQEIKRQAKHHAKKAISNTTTSEADKKNYNNSMTVCF